uniref:Uncharacterized protein n=1 Tax=Parascaris univalens TaxID=6257 RepID=A0A915B1W2_PARUN
METYNIMVDPRVCRGSVAANRRAQQERIRKEIHKKESERRFRINVVRNRLNTDLTRYPLDGAEAHTTKLSRISRLASMAGYEHLSKHKALLNDDFATPDRSTAIRRAITTPPPTSAGICGRSDALVQTVDSFDEHVQSIVHEMITLTLDSAVHSLVEEERCSEEAKKVAQLIDELSYERAVTQKLTEKIDETKVMHARKIREKEEKIREYEKQDSAQIAAQMVDRLIGSTIQKAVKGGVVRERATVRHVAADTRQLQRKSVKEKLVLAEVIQKTVVKVDRCNR